MKELSIEQKAKRYDEVVAMAQECITHIPDEAVDKYMLNMFPELQELDNEKIRKGIIKSIMDLHTDWLELHGVTKEDAIAWLEKQGEQKPVEWHIEDEQILNACLGHIPDEFLRRWLKDVIHTKYDKPTDKAEPKFKIGQWIVWQDKCYKVNYNGCGYELVDKNGLSTSLEYGTIDENAHLWSINDAKEGDILITENERPFIFKGCLDKIHSNNPVAHGGIDNSGCFYPCSNNCINRWTEGNVHPATKEQRDLLFAKMKEAGYEWNADKKEP